MGYIPIHHSIEEWKSDDSEDGRIGLLVGRHPVGIDQLLESGSELVRPEEGRRDLLGVDLVQDRGDARAALDRAPGQGRPDQIQVRGRDPAFCDQALLRHVQVEEVESVEHRLDLPHLDEPLKMEKYLAHRVELRTGSVNS